MLKFSGTASVGTYEALLQQVQFVSTTAVNKIRRVTWTLGNGVVYSTHTKHLYKFYSETVSWWTAKKACEQTKRYGMTGYLATVTSAAENDILIQRLLASGWIGATDVNVESYWKWISGPEAALFNQTSTAFWIGVGSASGGAPSGGWYSSWNPPTEAVVGGEPNGLEDEDFAAILDSGYWQDTTAVNPDVDGYVCEWGGLTSDSTVFPPSGIWGTVTLALEDCKLKGCGFIQSSADCQANTECYYTGSACARSCNYMGTAECESHPECYLNRDAAPPTCQVNPCQTMSDCSAKPTLCAVKGSTCVRISGCARWTTRAACVYDVTCQWETDKCTLAPCTNHGSNSKGLCNDTLCLARCAADQQCQLVADRCVNRQCFFTLATCPTSTCTLLNPSTGIHYMTGEGPVKILSSDQISAISLGSATFSTGIVVAMESQFRTGDSLLYFGDDDTFTAEWDSAHGMLTLVGIGSVTEVREVLNDVKFMSTEAFSAAKTITVSVFDSSVGHKYGPVYFSTLNKFVEFVPFERATRSAARAQCESRVFHEMKGSLAELKSHEQAKLVVQSLGAMNGWIGGQGKNTADGTVWTWATSGELFFMGTSNTGRVVSYANFDTNEPAQVYSNTILFVMMQSNGKWAALADGTAKAIGYYCEYTPSAAAVGFAAVATIEPAGCFPKPCSRTDEELCIADPACEWKNSACQVSDCGTYTTAMSACEKHPGCFFDPTLSNCQSNVVDVCATKTNVDCTTVKGCQVMEFGCTSSGCDYYPTKSSCNYHQECAWKDDDNKCATRLCSATNQVSCVVDPLCEWNSTSTRCQPQKCVSSKTEAACKAEGGCVWTEGASPQCTVNLCPYDEKVFCDADPLCLWQSGTCVRALCRSTLSKDACEAVSGCSYSASTSTCVKAICTYTSRTACDTDAACTWDTTIVVGYDDSGTPIIQSRCRARQASELVMAAAEECIEKEKDMSSMMICLAGVTAFLGICLAWMVWRQRPGRYLQFNLQNASDQHELEDFGEEGLREGLGDLQKPLSGLHSAEYSGKKEGTSRRRCPCRKKKNRRPKTRRPRSLTGIIVRSEIIDMKLEGREKVKCDCCCL